MSVNRSVQAAQRRRAAPTDPVQLRGPNTSINSAQLFANQSKPGAGPNIPVGKLAGQQAQQNINRQYEQQNESSSGIESVSKMTLPQAITLITLRLGKVESMIQNQTFGTSMRSNMQFDTDNDNDNATDMVQVDANVLQSILTRLESLEKRSSVSTANGASAPELILLKQQIETFKPIITQTKTSTNSLLKEHKEFKTLFETLRNDLEETKELVMALQNLTMDNSQKLLALDMSGEHLLVGFDQSLNEMNDTAYDTFDEPATESHETVNNQTNDLKELVKQEFNLVA